MAMNRIKIGVKAEMVNTQHRFKLSFKNKIDRGIIAISFVFWRYYIKKNNDIVGKHFP